MGLVSLDAKRHVDASLGMLVDWLKPGVPARDVMPFLVGLEDVLDEIASGQRPPLALPRVALQERVFAEKVLSVEIMPSDSPSGINILLRDETELSGLEQNLLQQRNELAIANEALDEARQRAEVALQEKASFLANVSHDLKTPLQVIIGNAEILRSDLPIEEREAFLQDVLDNSNFLLALITDLLDASALEADQLQLTEDVIDIEAMLERVLSMARRLPNGSDRRFHMAIDEGHRAVRADPMRLQRLLLNIVSNAVKFTSSNGSIAVKTRPDDEGDLVIEIDDDGCGIDPGMMKRVFEPFVMGGVAEGSGLGLHIAKGLAELHGADLTLASELGSGTKARLRLPKSRIVSAGT